MQVEINIIAQRSKTILVTNLRANYKKKDGGEADTQIH